MKLGDKIKYEEVFHCVFYAKPTNEPPWDKKLYVNAIDLEESEPIITEMGHIYYKGSNRKLVFRKEQGEGIVIGQTRRNEGKYLTGGDDEQPSLEIKKTYCFWVVAIAMNKTVLVPKLDNLKHEKDDKTA